MSYRVIHGTVLVSVLGCLCGAGDRLAFINQASAEPLMAATYNVRVAVQVPDIDYWIDTRRHLVFESIKAYQPDFMGFQEAYARRANNDGITQQTALGELFEGTKWRYFSWEDQNVFNMNPFIVNTDRFRPVDYGTITVNFEDFLGSDRWMDFFDLHTFFHGNTNGNVHYLGPERFVNWVVADDLQGGGRVAFLTSHYETYIGENRKGSEYDDLFQYFSELVNSSFGYASEQIVAQADQLKIQWGNLHAIIGGDFETQDPELPAQKAYTDAGYRETWRFINGNGRRPTRGIDNLFVIPDGLTIDGSFYDQAGYTDGASDHKPLYAQLTQTPCALGLTVENLIAGAQATFTITGGTPGAKAVTVFGFKPGESIISNFAGYCATFGIKNVNQKRIVGGINNTFDNNGEIAFNQNIPAQTFGLNVLFQTAENGTCPDECLSNLIQEIIQ